MNSTMIILLAAFAVGFLIGTAVTGLVWYVKEYCMDSLYLKGYSKGYEKGYKEATVDSLKVYEHELEEMKKDGNAWKRKTN